MWLKGFDALMKWFFGSIHIEVYRNGVMETLPYVMFGRRRKLTFLK